jgi:hypothetical protein
MTRFRFLWIAFVLAGCYPGPENPPDYGPYPDGYESIVTTWIQGHVFNAPTVKDVSMTKPVQDQLWVGKLYGGFAYGYKTCLSYDVQDRDGRYKGIAQYTVLLKDGAVAHAGVYDLVNEGC